MSTFDPLLFRQQFPLIATNDQRASAINNTLIYFDNAATSHKPECVIKRQSDFYRHGNANVHRGSHQLSAKATQSFEQARETVKKTINASSFKEIIWTKGTTESINLVANSWGLAHLKSGDEIVLSFAEHHANIVPWQMVAEKTGAQIKVLPLNKQGRIDKSQLVVINAKTRLVCVNHISNVVGKLNPIENIIRRAKNVGALVLIDGAQTIAHHKIDVQQLDCDFYVFSAHKAYGPMGLGVLYGKKQLLEKMSPYQTGGEMIAQVSLKKTTFNDLPFKFEAGTPDVAAVLAFAQALTFMQNYGDKLNEYEKELSHYAYEQLAKLNEVEFLFDECPDIPLFSFKISGHHNHDIAASLDSYGIAVRSGHHCAMPLMEYLGINGCIRISLAAYNTFAEIDYFIASLKTIIALESTAITYQTINKMGDAKPIDVNKQTYSILKSNDIIDLFLTVKAWDAKHREIMLLGKKLSKLPLEQRNEQTLINGCESKAWLTYHKDAQGCYYFNADSDAKIIRGLLVIILAAFNGKNAVDIITFDIENYFSKLGLLQHLSPSRGNGVKAIVEKIILIATHYK